jgi:hypothetical protein
MRSPVMGPRRVHFDKYVIPAATRFIAWRVGKSLFEFYLLESLILAQDERWRRA